MGGIGGVAQLSPRSPPLISQPFLESKQKGNTWGVVYKIKCSGEWKGNCSSLKDLQLAFPSVPWRLQNESLYACSVYKIINAFNVPGLGRKKSRFPLMEPGLQWNDAFLESEYLTFDSRIVYKFIFYILKELFICCILSAVSPFVSSGSAIALRESNSPVSRPRKPSSLLPA